MRATYADTYTLALRLTGDEEDARDVVQESYLRAYRGLKRFRGDAQFTTWLYRITANCAANQLRPAHAAPPRRARRGRRAGRRATPTTTRPSWPTRPTCATGWRERSTCCRPGCGRSSCCATSTTCPTRPSPPSWASPSRRPRCACTGPGASCASELFPVPGRTRAGRGAEPMRCDDIGRGPGRRPPTDRCRLDRRAPAATSSSACAARPSSSSTGSCCGALRTLRTEVLEPAPGLLAEILATVEAGRRAPRRPVAAQRPPGRPTSAAWPRPPRPGRRRRHRARHPLPAGPASRWPVDRRPGSRRLPTRPAEDLGAPRGSFPRRAVAQLAEHRSPKPAVGGSSPSCPARPRPSLRHAQVAAMAMNRETKRMLQRQGAARRRRRARRSTRKAPPAPPAQGEAHPAAAVPPRGAGRAAQGGLADPGRGHQLLDHRVHHPRRPHRRSSPLLDLGLAKAVLWIFDE